MGLIVQKFGGTRVADADRIHRGRRAIAAKEKGNQVVVVAAMGDTTDHLIELARQVCSHGGCDKSSPSARWTSSWPPASRSTSP